VLLLLIAGGIGVGVYKNQQVTNAPNSNNGGPPALTTPQPPQTPANTKDSPEAIRNWAFSERIRGKWLPDKGSEESPIQSITIMPSRADELITGQEERIGGYLELNVKGKLYPGKYWLSSKSEKQFTLTFSAVDDRGITQVRDIQVTESGSNGLSLKWEPYKHDPTFDDGPTRVYRSGWRPGEKLMSAMIGGTWTAKNDSATYSFQSDLRATRNGIPGVFNIPEDDTIEVLTREGNKIAIRRYRLRYLNADRLQALLVRDTTNSSFNEDAAQKGTWYDWTQSTAKTPANVKDEKKPEEPKKAAEKPKEEETYKDVK
jgi:hypothetical protein